MEEGLNFVHQSEGVGRNGTDFRVSIFFAPETSDQKGGPDFHPRLK